MNKTRNSKTARHKGSIPNSKNLLFLFLKRRRILIASQIYRYPDFAKMVADFDSGSRPLDADEFRKERGGDRTELI